MSYSSFRHYKTQYTFLPFFVTSVEKQRTKEKTQREKKFSGGGGTVIAVFLYSKLWFVIWCNVVTLLLFDIKCSPDVSSTSMEQYVEHFLLYLLCIFLEKRKHMYYNSCSFLRLRVFVNIKLYKERSKLVERCK